MYSVDDASNFSAQQAPIHDGYDSRYFIIKKIDLLIELLVKQPDADITSCLNELIISKRRLINNENNYMRILGYHEAKQHGISHMAITTKAAELINCYDQGLAIQPGQLNYLKNIWLYHIKNYDDPFMEYLASRECFC
jgi:hemerythrin